MNKLTMTKIIITSLWVSLSGQSYASSDHHHEDDHDHDVEIYTEGRHGGKQFTQDNFAIEMTIFEQGIPPEMRIYGYIDGDVIAPNLLDVTVTLQRLGEGSETIQFAAEGEYVVGNTVIKEPHSFDVTIEASYQGQHYHWHFDSYEGRTEINDRLLALTKIKTEAVTEQTLTFKDTLFGVIAAQEERFFRVHAPYEGIVKSVKVSVGDKVTKGQTLLTVLNNKTLQTYRVQSPANGEVTSRNINAGDYASTQTLISVTDLSEVWVEISAFPETIEKLAIGQKVTIYDMHQHDSVDSTISYIAPVMTGGHIARARTVIANPDGHWRPGMHIKADVEVAQRTVPLAVKNSALQTFRDTPVVFAKFGNTFEVRMVELGESDGEFSEVLSGIAPQTDYVTDNSFLLKADILKDGASHHH